MTAGYSENGISGKTILAFILLIVDVALYFLLGHSVAKSHARHQEKYPQIPEGMCLTVSKDIESIVYFDASYDDKVHVKPGTVVLAGAMSGDELLFFYSETGKDLSRFKGMDHSVWVDRKEELGLIELGASFDCFEEKEQLEAIYNEAKEKTKTMQESAFKEEFEPVIIKGVILLAIGLFLTYAFSMLKWHIFLYAADIVGFFVIYFHMSSLWCH